VAGGLNRASVSNVAPLCVAVGEAASSWLMKFKAALVSN